MNRLRDELRRKGRAPVMVDGDDVDLAADGLAARGRDRTGGLRALRGGAGAAATGGARGHHRARGDGLLVRRAGRDARQADAGRRAQGGQAGAAAPGRGNETVRPIALLDDVAGAILDGTAVDWTERRFGRRLDRAGARRAAQDTGDSRSRGGRSARSCARATAARKAPRRGATGAICACSSASGRGAFGEVYRAWDTRLDREVALKLLASTRLRPTVRSSIIEEGRLLARVRHPNVVTIYGAERIDGRVGLWMEFVRGRTLEQALRDGTTFSATDVERLGVELCRAVVGGPCGGPTPSRHQGAERHAGGRRPAGADGLRHRTRVRAHARRHRQRDTAVSGARSADRQRRHGTQRRLQRRRACSITC